jgi:zinc transporter, ZIP family
MSLWVITLAALLTALATGLGALPFAFVDKVDERWIGRSGVIAGGLMTGASIGLIYEGLIRNLGLLTIGAAVGVVVILLTERHLARDDLSVGRIKGADARRVLLIVAVMTVHSFTEGVAVGVSFGARDFGWAVAIAIAVHNIPEGLAISLPVVSGGGSWVSAAGWSIFSSLPQPLMAVPAYIGVKWLHDLLPAGLGFAAGAMLYIVFFDLIPEARKTVAPLRIVVIFVVSAAAILGLSAALAL